MPRGRIEVITRGMFSGKSEELVRRLRREGFARKSIRAVKHASDCRYHETHIGCHGGQTFEALPVKDAEALVRQVAGFEVVGIDEGQFFGDDLPDACEHLANAGVLVIVAGLDLTAEGKPFHPMPALMAIAEDVTKLRAVCVVCGEKACRSHHLAGKDVDVEVGAKSYEARCRGCWKDAIG